MLTEKTVRQAYQPKTIAKPFTGQTVYLQGNKVFKDTWQELVECGGGNAMKRWFKSKCCV